MRITIDDLNKIDSYIQKIDTCIKQDASVQWEKFVKLGSQYVRLICYSDKFTPLVQKQLAYSLKDTAEKYDATLIIWNEKDTKDFSNSLIDKTDLHMRTRMRLEMLGSKKDYVNLEIMDNAYSKHTPLIRINAETGIIEAFDKQNNTYYYGVENLEPEEFIKQGHIFVQALNKISKNPKLKLSTWCRSWAGQ